MALSVLISSPDVAHLREHLASLLQDVFAGAAQTELRSTSHLQRSAVSEQKKIHPQPKLFARQNVKSGYVRYFQRAPGKANPTCWKGFSLVCVQADRGDLSVLNWK